MERRGAGHKVRKPQDCLEEAPRLPGPLQIVYVRQLYRQFVLANEFPTSLLFSDPPFTTNFVQA